MALRTVPGRSDSDNTRTAGPTARISATFCSAVLPSPRSRSSSTTSAAWPGPASSAATVTAVPITRMPLPGAATQPGQAVEYHRVIIHRGNIMVPRVGRPSVLSGLTLGMVLRLSWRPVMVTRSDVPSSAIPVSRPRAVPACRNQPPDGHHSLRREQWDPVSVDLGIEHVGGVDVRYPGSPVYSANYPGPGGQPKAGTDREICVTATAEDEIAAHRNSDDSPGRSAYLSADRGHRPERPSVTGSAGRSDPLSLCATGRWLATRLSLRQLYWLRSGQSTALPPAASAAPTHPDRRRRIERMPSLAPGWVVTLRSGRRQGGERIP